jgi:hypothetical protein
MGVWLVDADVLASSRFAISPLIETIDVLGVLATAGPQPWERAWLARHHPAFAARVGADPFSTSLVSAVVTQSWMPDFIGRPPRTAEASFETELARLRATPADTARSDLAVAVGGPLPAALDIPDPAGAVADLLAWVWHHTLRRDWPRRRRLYQADIVSRTAAISQHGWAAAITGLSPKIRWLGDGRLRNGCSARPGPISCAAWTSRPAPRIWSRSPASHSAPSAPTCVSCSTANWWNAAAPVRPCSTTGPRSASNSSPKQRLRRPTVTAASNKCAARPDPGCSRRGMRSSSGASFKPSGLSQ